MINTIKELQELRGKTYSFWRTYKEEGHEDLAELLLEMLTLMTLLESMPPSWIKDENTPIYEQVVESMKAREDDYEF